VQSFHQHLPTGPDRGLRILARAAGSRNKDTENGSSDESAFQLQGASHDLAGIRDCQLAHRNSRPD
jgi:hypothetical protein